MFYSLLFCKSGISLFHKAITIRGIFFTMSKTKKILTTTAAVAAATTGAMVATTAHADTTATSAQAKQSTMSAQDQLNNMQAQHSQAESQMASDNAAEMASATTETNNQVAKLQDELKTNQASQAAEDAPKLASGTKAINQKADQATAKENATYSDAVKSQEAANKQALADAAKNIYTPAQKQQLENKKTSQYNQEKAKLDQEHQTKLNNLKADHDKQATKLNDEIKANQTSAEQAHDQAVQNAKDNLASQISATQSKVDQLTTKVNDDQTDVNNAKATVDQAQSRVDSAKKALSDTKGASQTSSQSFPKAEYDGITQYPIWKDTNPADQRKATFDANGQLTGQDAIEINEFVANILNGIRQDIINKYPNNPYMRTRLLKVNANSIKVASDSAKKYTQAGDIGGHNLDILYGNQSKYNLSSWGESAIDGGHDPEATSTTIADLKNQVYDEIVSLTNDDFRNGNNGGHMKMLLGFDGAGEYLGLNFTPTQTRYLFMSFNNPADATNNYPLANDSATTPTTNLDVLQTAVNQAQQNLDNANSALKNAQAQLKNDQSKLDTANANLASLKKGDVTKDIPGVTESPKVKALKDQLANLEKSYAADVKAENDAYNQKKSALDAQYQKDIDAIKAYPENTDQLKQAQAQKLAQLKKDHEAKLAKIKADAEQQIAALKQQLADSHNDVNQPIIDKINALKAALAAKQDQLNQKLAALKANDAAEYNALRDKLMPKQAAAGVANGYLTAGGQVVSLATKSGHSASSETTALPRTGNNSSLAVVVLGAVSMMFGFGLMKKRG